MLLTSEGRRFPQIAASINYILDNPERYLSSTGNKDIYEFGVFKGESLRKILDNLEDNNITYNCVYGIDTFDGLIESESFPKFKRGLYSTKNLYGEEWKSILNNKLDNKAIFIQKKFSELQLEDFCLTPLKAIIVHIDSDLKKSALDALNFMFCNNLLDESSLILYDEFISSNNPSSEGESAAHKIITEQYKVEFKEIFHCEYFDKDCGIPIRQSVFRIDSIGKISDIGINIEL